jgi:hypothetical protein
MKHFLWIVVALWVAAACDGTHEGFTSDVSTSELSVSLPDLKFSKGLSEVSESESTGVGTLTIDWGNATRVINGNIEERWIPLKSKSQWSLYRSTEINGKTQDVTSPTISFLYERTSNDSTHYSVFTLAPDVHYLRKNDLEVTSIRDTSVLSHDFSGVLLVSNVNGRIQYGQLYHKGKPTWHFTINHRVQTKAEVDASSSPKRHIFITFLDDSYLSTRSYSWNIDQENGLTLLFCDICGFLRSSCTCIAICPNCDDYVYNCICTTCIYCSKPLNECECVKCQWCGQWGVCMCPICNTCRRVERECSCSCSDRTCECTHCKGGVFPPDFVNH